MAMFSLSLYILSTVLYMENLLYYPYINLPRTDWTARALLYYNHVGSIVPMQYVQELDNHDPYMRELINHGLVTQVDPMSVLENPWQVYTPFLGYIGSREVNLGFRRYYFKGRKNQAEREGKIAGFGTRIHSGKFDSELFYSLSELGLAEKLDGNWYCVERKTANELMTFLADVIGAKLQYQPATDQCPMSFPYLTKKFINEVDFSERLIEGEKRELILKELMPFPQELNFRRLRSFKDRYQGLLDSFRNRIELIVLNPAIDIESDLFKEHIKELKIGKEELSARMNESRFGTIFFGSICGIIGAFMGLAEGDTAGAVVRGLPGFASAVYEALRIERVRDIPNQTGMKYLALLDKNLRPRL